MQLLKKYYQSYTFLFWMVPISIFLFYVLVESTALWNGGDGEMHFLISKYAKDHLHLYLDHWGKPLFTLLSSPFAQFGRKGVVLFNMILIGSTAFFSFGTLKQLGYRFAEWVIPIVVFCPIMFENVFSGLTETLFAFLFAGGLYLFACKRWIGAAILFSFLPFSRSEGLFLIPLIFLFFIWNRKFKQSTFLLFGFVVYSIVGWLSLGDFWWVFTHNPYTAPDGIYGSGSLFHFLLEYKYIVGRVFGLYILIGLLAYLMDFRKIMALEQRVLLLGLLGFGLVFCMHSILWWKGIRGSAGLVRVLVAVLPGILIFPIVALDWVGKSSKRWAYFFAVGMLCFGVLTTLKLHRVPIQADAYLQTQMAAVNWYKDSDFYNSRLVAADVVLRSRSGKDPFDTKQVMTPSFIDKEDPSLSFEPGQTLFWDAKYYPVEERLPLGKFLENPYFKVIKHFKPPHYIEFQEGVPFEIYFFERVSEPIGGIQEDHDTLYYQDYAQIQDPYVKHLNGLDFELLTGGHQFSKTYSAHVSALQFGDCLSQSYRVIGQGRIQKNGPVNMVFEVKRGEESLVYQFKTFELKSAEGTTKMEWDLSIEQALHPTDQVSIYLYIPHEIPLELDFLGVEKVCKHY